MTQQDTQPPAETLDDLTLREAVIVLDVFLAAYARRSDDMPVYLDSDDDNLLRWGHLRTILAALTRRAGGDAGEGDPVSRCSIGSCKRHGQCMYMPCRAVTPAGGDATAALVKWAREQMALPDGSGWLGGHIDENHRYKLRDLVGAIDAATPKPPAGGDAGSASGTFACPICGEDKPHHHTPPVVDAYQTKGSRK